MVSQKIVERLSLYRRVLTQLRTEGETTIFSHQLAALVKCKAPQVRRDVMQLGYSGVPNTGYAIVQLLGSISDFLDAPRSQRAALVGVGHLGMAILAYFSGRWRRLSITAAFDNNPAKTGQVIRGCRCYPVADLGRVVQEQGLALGVITVPAPEAQSVADALCQAGVKGLLNFAPVRLQIPEGIYIEDVDLTTAFEKVAYFARQMETEPASRLAVEDGA